MGARTLTAVIDRDLFQLRLPLRLWSLSNALCLTLQLVVLFSVPYRGVSEHCRYLVVVSIPRYSHAVAFRGGATCTEKPM